MKSKVSLILIMFIIAVAIGGCGYKKVEELPATESVVIGGDEDIKPEETEEITTETVDEETVEEVGTFTTGDLDFEAFETDENKDHQFGDIGYIAQYRDVRNQTGLNSESTDDVWKYLDDNGNISTDAPDELWDMGVNSYTGRWAYPTVTECEATKDFFLYDWTDSFCSYIADPGENNHAILICTGYDVFNSYTDANSDAEYTFDKYKTVDVNGESIDLYSVSAAEDTVTYLYKLGGFTVVVEFMGGEDMIDEVIQNISL